MHHVRVRVRSKGFCHLFSLSFSHSPGRQTDGKPRPHVLGCAHLEYLVGFLQTLRSIPKCVRVETIAVAAEEQVFYSTLALKAYRPQRKRSPNQRKRKSFGRLFGEAHTQLRCTVTQYHRHRIAVEHGIVRNPVKRCRAMYHVN